MCAYLTVGDVAGVSISIGTAKSLLVVFLGTGEIGSPAQLVSTSVHCIRCQTASRNRASAAPMLQLDHLISGNSATSAWTPSRRGRNSALRTSFATIFAFALVSRLLAKAAQSDERGTLPALAPDRIATTTCFFQDLVLLPLMLRALFGEKLKQLCAEIGPHVKRSVAFFLAACRHGGVT